MSFFTNTHRNSLSVNIFHPVDTALDLFFLSSFSSSSLPLLLFLIFFSSSSFPLLSPCSSPFFFVCVLQGPPGIDGIMVHCPVEDGKDDGGRALVAEKVRTEKMDTLKREH